MSHHPTPIRLSVAAPAFNEAEGIQAIVLNWREYLSRDPNIAAFEIIVCNDGSQDETGNILDRLAQSYSEIRPIHFSKNQGRYLENIVYLDLRRRYQDVFYYKTENQLEVDFLVREGNKIVLLIQVTESLRDPKTRDREYQALVKAMQELGVDKGLILTQDEEPADAAYPQIEVTPIYRWLLTAKP